MSSTISPCACDGNIQNWGKPGCLTNLGAPSALVIAQRKTSAGVDNFMDLTVDWDQAYIEGFYCAEDADNRYIIIPQIQAYTPEQAEAITDESSYGITENVRDGVASLMFEYRSKDIYKDIRKWKGVDCLDLMAFMIDTEGNLLGKYEDGDKFGGFLIAANTLTTIPSPHNNETTNKYTIKFDLELGSGFEEFDYVSASSIDYSLLLISPLRDVNIKITGITATTIDFVTTLDYGDAKNRSVKGLDVFTGSDLNLRNVTDASDVVFATLTVDPLVDGGYNGTMASQDSSDLVYVQPISNVKKPLALNRFPSVTAIIP